MTRPPFIISKDDVEARQHSYPNSDEKHAHNRAIGRAAGLKRIGLHHVRVAPGQRTSYPHAESHEEEFVYVISGELDAWIDGHLHRMTAGDLAAFPAGTGTCHSLLNNGNADAVLLIGGESDNSDNRIYYPLNQERKADMPWSDWWDDIPLAEQGDHDGRARAKDGTD